jgi:hypothetical protein
MSVIGSRKRGSKKSSKPKRRLLSAMVMDAVVVVKLVFCCFDGCLFSDL